MAARTCIGQDGAGPTRVLVQEVGWVVHPPIPHKPARLPAGELLDLGAGLAGSGERVGELEARELLGCAQRGMPKGRCCSADASGSRVQFTRAQGALVQASQCTMRL